MFLIYPVVFLYSVVLCRFFFVSLPQQDLLDEKTIIPPALPLNSKKPATFLFCDVINERRRLFALEYIFKSTDELICRAAGEVFAPLFEVRKTRVSLLCLLLGATGRFCFKLSTFPEEVLL